MDLRISLDKITEVVADALVVPIYEDETPEEGLCKELDGYTEGVISSIFERKEFRGKANETAYIHMVKDLKVRRLLLVGMGKQASLGIAQFQQAAGTAARSLRSKKLKSLAFLYRGGVAAEHAGQGLAEGSLLSAFDIDTYKTKDREDKQIEQFTILVEAGDQAAMEKGVAYGRILGESANFAREMINEPSSHLTPIDMANRAKEMAAQVGLEIDLIDEEQMKVLGMGALLGVSQGSHQEARLIVLKYSHPEAKAGEVIALVGKGITFDSGGISIKPSEGMEKMKYDMAGAGAVMGAMRAIGLLKPRANVVGVMACAENMPSGTAIKPGDVLKAMSGQTIEVINTDAEGRLVLADAIVYTREKLGATKIVDLATLTGAVGVALGPVYAALLGTCPEMIEQLKGAGSAVNERYWQLPLDEEYGEQLRSDIADIKNSGGRPAGTITGGYFIKEFTGDTPWVHIDIASTAWNNEKKPYLGKGPTAMGVRTLAQWVLNISN